MTETSSIAIHDEGPIRIVTFRRPAAMNAWDRAMRLTLVEAMAEADADPAVDALVVTGEGERAFGAGQDLREAGPRDAAEADAWVDEWDRLFSGLRAVGKPTICALNGVAAGSHFQFALLADARIGHAGVRMGQPEIKSGVASSMGPWAIATFMGPLAAQDLALSGRMMDAAECERRGLLRVVPREEVLSASIALATDLAARPKLAFRLTKARLRDLTEASFREVFPVWKRFMRETIAAREAGA
ncbi:enoyl-CoA hydratase/isomerase family protein [Enterovirga rhinocerotis]|uniref:Enoyl-CoA hydratase/carnithine racemase n=1 Tax=Enterovirga rhinocerotis TaxID=1339210 RepID=A0A4R7BJE9_9HYPH|nr:enoyl-CoA hydratase/isomerase family protein [Enterovirga rhinocerotis]TDR85464.1 enoyl-CoA hydratase/carnithine racemase [Enterovirga rhinocerotis]